MKFHVKAFSFALICCLAATTADAHFVWLKAEGEGDKQQVQVYFGEDASPDDPALLSRLANLKVWQATAKGMQPLKLNRNSESLTATPQSAVADSVIIATCDLGVISRGDVAFRLKYYAKTSTGKPAVWQSVECGKQLALDITPSWKGQQMSLRATFNGAPVAGAEVKAIFPSTKPFTGVTDAKGEVSFDTGKPGLCSVRVRHIEKAGGELDGKKYADTRHYCTIAIDTAATTTTAATDKLPRLETAITSFGAAIADDVLYIYGGHTGSAHSYSTQEQGNALYKLDLNEPAGWKKVATGPHLQGLAMAPYKGKIYRVGGFTAKNKEGEEHDLWSQDSFAMFDPATSKWTDLPSLPEQRSSFDAAVLDGVLYVAGGWKMAGEADSQWHNTAYKFDLRKKDAKWQKIADTPFRRRAIAAAAHDGKIYVIGGMQEKGGITRKTAVYNPENNTWTEGPELPKAGRMTGFGSAAFATGGNLYVSTVDGDLLKLSSDGKQWEHQTKTPTPRFFHRMLPLTSNKLLVVGGANMQIGKFKELEVLDVK